MAENERVFTTVFKADIDDFGKSAQDLKRYVNQVNSEFADATAGMGKWSDNTDGLKAKITQLNGVLQAEQTKLDASKKKYAELVSQGKQNTDQAQKLATEINNQSAKVKNIQGDIEHYTDNLEELEKAHVNTREELEKHTKKVEESKAAMKEFADGAGKVVVAGLAGIATACVGAVAGLSSLVDETKEIRTQMGQLETAFTTAGHSADAATKTYSDLNAVLGDSGKATEASMHLAQLAKDEKELDKYTNILTGVYATFGDSLPVEGLAEAMNHTAKLGSVQGNLGDALEWAGINVDDFNERLGMCNSEEERADLITRKLNGIYGESATKYKEVNKEVIAANKAQDDYNQAMADIAEVAQPVITKFKTAMVDVLQKILEKFKEVDLEKLIGGISSAITWLTDNVLTVLQASIDWLIDNVDWLLPMLETLAIVIGSITAAWAAYNAITKAATIVQAAFNVVMNANPIGIVITSIGALIAVIVLCIKHWDDIKAAASKAWDGIVSVWNKVASWFKEKVIDPVVNFFKDNWQSILLFMVNPIAGAFKIIYDNCEGFRKFVDNLVKIVGEFFVNMWDGIKNAAKSAWDGIVSVWNTVTGWFDTNIIQPVSNFFTALWDGIINAAKSAWDGIVSVWNTVTGWFDTNIIQPVSNFFTALWDGIVSALKPHIDNIIGLAQGCWEIIEAVWKLVSSWFNENVIQPVSKFFTELWDDIKNAAKSTWDGIVSVWNAVTGWFDTNIIQPVSKFFTDLWEGIKKAAISSWDGIKNAAKSAWDGIVSVWNAVTGWFNDKIIKPVSDFFKKLWNGIKDAAKSAWDGIKSVWNAVTSWFNSTIISPVKNAFTNMWNGLKTGASSAWDGIKSVFSKVGSFFSDTFSKAWGKVKDIFSTGGKVFDGIKDGIATAFKNIVNGLIGGINKVVSVPFNALNAALRKIRDIEILGITPFAGRISEVSVPQIPLLAHGGIVDKPTLAMIGDAGKEAVLPLNKNTEWINELAAKINGGTNGGQTVTVTQNFAGLKTTALEAHKARIELMRTLKYAGV